ncbi:MFS transporter [Buttiauxella warmboldiae]|uniref:MFS transporter n=1 Tax=Buttiauxella warmboldiae TaxID=82993 RepID=A0A3N5DDQ0_9ENTR|nr:MFS transporter [Buttiauxella warmboldiae]RPH26884.1 MFS transporter [Buttiauxella warmboldiae]
MDVTHSEVSPQSWGDKKRFTRIIPMLAVMYLLALICRNNIGYAFHGMDQSFNLSATISGLVGGIFFIGYLLLQIPGGHLAQKVSAKKIITFCMVAWGLVCVSMGFVQSGGQLLTMRFLLGLSQSMLYPTTLILIGKWFPQRERARAIGYWSIGATVSNFIVGPLSGFLVDTFSWQMLFVFQGIPVLIAVIFWIWLIAETPAEAKFLSKAEKDYLATEFANDTDNTIKNTNKSVTSLVLKNKFVWLLTCVFLLNNMFNYGLSIWWPTIASSVTGSSYTLVGILSTIAPLIGLVVMFFVSSHSDRTGERKWHAVSILLICGVALAISALTEGAPFVSIIFILIAQGIWAGFSPVFWTIPSIIISSAAIGAATGLINGVGNLGGFVGPYLFGYLIDLTGSTQMGLFFIVGVQIMAGLLLATLKSPKLEIATKNIQLKNSTSTR